MTSRLPSWKCDVIISRAPSIDEKSCKEHSCKKSDRSELKWRSLRLFVKLRHSRHHESVTSYDLVSYLLCQSTSNHGRKTFLHKVRLIWVEMTEPLAFFVKWRHDRHLVSVTSNKNSAMSNQEGTFAQNNRIDPRCNDGALVFFAKWRHCYYLVCVTSN